MSLLSLPSSDTRNICCAIDVRANSEREWEREREIRNVSSIWRIDDFNRQTDRLIAIVALMVWMLSSAYESSVCVCVHGSTCGDIDKS